MSNYEKTSLRIRFGDELAGTLTSTEGGGTTFTYDRNYLQSGGQPISRTLPIQVERHEWRTGLLPFFDNLVAEGWLKNAQARYLKIRPNDRFRLLAHFGYDCAGAVWVDVQDDQHTDPFGEELPENISNPEAWIAAQSSRASLSGVQPKLLARQEGTKFRPVRNRELSTHIAKIETHDSNHPNIIELEYLTSIAARDLLPSDQIAKMEIGTIQIPTSQKPKAVKALMIERFDRRQSRAKQRENEVESIRRLHFEEFNQLFGHMSEQKYDSSYENLCSYFNEANNVIPAERFKLVRRILVSLLLGNTDAHAKNFALFDVGQIRTLTPSYDLVASAVYPQYDVVALSIAGADEINITSLKAKHIAIFARSIGMSNDQIEEMVEDIKQRLPKAKETISNSTNGHQALKDQLLRIIEKRWNGTFSSIGNFLSKKQNTDG